MNAEHCDVLIIGAGLSGIGAACHLRRRCPGRRFAILEARARLGGTWDLFRYPGVRSDSDMFTLGYGFRPWTGEKSIVDGEAILAYIRDTARAHDVERAIRFHSRVTRASWSTPDARWTVEVERGQGQGVGYLTCDFLLVCSGYYDYAAGYCPDFPGSSRFAGKIIHPQNWTADVAYANQRVIVIGSGATAVTVVPQLAQTAAHVTLLQRSPTYVVAWPDEDRLANAVRRLLPARAAGAIARWKNVLGTMYFYQLCKRAPERAKTMILDGVRAELGADYDLAHFTPRYNPWDQRLCLAPNGDLFRSIKAGRTSVVTDEIASFTARGIALRSGRELAADIIVTATGLNLQLLGGAELEIDGRPAEPATTFSYKGALYSDIPNLAAVFGYTNASWTLKADLICTFVCRLLNYMQRHGYTQCTPRNGDPRMPRLAPVDFTSGYFLRAMEKLPRQGPRKPWRIYQNYLQDLVALRLGRIADGVLEFSSHRASAPRAQDELGARRGSAQVPLSRA